MFRILTPKIGEDVAILTCAYFSDGLKLNHQLVIFGLPRFPWKTSQEAIASHEKAIQEETSQPVNPESSTSLALATWIISRWWQLKDFLFSPRSLGKGSNLTSIVFNWVETNQSDFSFSMTHSSDFRDFLVFGKPTWKPYFTIKNPTKGR